MLWPYGSIFRRVTAWRIYYSFQFGFSLLVRVLRFIISLYLSMRHAWKWRIYKRKLENCFQFYWIKWELIDALETSFETFLHPSLLHFLSLFPHILLTNATLIEDLEMTSLWNHKCYWSSSSSSSGRVVKGLSIVVSQGYETRDHFLCVKLFSVVTNNKWR